MTDIKLISELLDALLGNQISESLSEEVRNSIYQTRTLSSSNSTLEDCLIDALVSGRSMVISGSAGGGKTMLIEYIVSKVKERNPYI
jgi:flagellar biosynthesis GTPase FlhF